MKAYAAIGSRSLSPLQIALCRKVGVVMAQKGWTLHTGAAQGADQAYAVGALTAGGRVMLHLPWDTYERKWVAEARSRFPSKVRSQAVESSPHYHKAESSVFVFHPAAEHLSRSVILLHARNYNIICPSGDDQAVGFVVAFPGPRGGGTIQGVRVADCLGVPVVRLDKVTIPEAKQQIESLSKEGPP